MTGSSPAGPGAARYERVGAAAVLAIGRPQRRNAIDGPTAEAMMQAVRAFNDDPDARVLVVTGDEEAFCAGADLTSLESLRPRVGKPEGVFGVRRFRRSLRSRRSRAGASEAASRWPPGAI